MRRFLFAAIAAAIFIPSAGEASWVRRQFRILDFNMDGRNQPAGSTAVATFLAQQASAHNANVITLQEVCASQFGGILARLRSVNRAWTGTYKNFGNQPGCSTGRHGLAIFTLGVHDRLEWRYLSDRVDLPVEDDMRWWGIMKVRYRGVDIFSTHVMNSNKHIQIPEVADFVSRRSSFFLLAGDFNARPGEPVIDDFYARWFEIDVERKYTHPSWPSFDPKKIDYVWTNRKPISRWAVVRIGPSNHKMIRGAIEHWVWIPN